MKKLQAVLMAVVAGCSVAQAVVVTPGDSTAPWLGFMNVSELPSNGGNFVFGSPWGVADLVSTFNDASDTVTFAVNNIGDPNPFWYTPAGGPGAAGNKIMEANLYVESTGVINGELVQFQGCIISNTLTEAHVGIIFIRDFAPDYSSFNETTAPMSVGAFSLALPTVADLARHVQYGFQVKGACVWVTDVAAFGNVVISTGTGGCGGPTCDSIDFNNDGGVFDPTDIDALLSVFSEGPCIPDTQTCNDIDFNNDGGVFDPCDISSFLTVFSEGPCTPCGL